MTRITSPGASGADGHQAADGGVTLTLTPEQLKALGLQKLPAEGAQVLLHGTATVTRSGNGDGAGDTDDDAAVDAQGGDDDADEAGAVDGADAADEAGAGRAALTLRVTGLTLIQPRKAADKVLYGEDAAH